MLDMNSRAVRTAAPCLLTALLCGCAVEGPQAEPAPEQGLYDAGRVEDLLRTPASDWAEGDVEYIKSLIEADLPVAKWHLRAVEAFGKWIEYDSGWVTREEQQAIAARIAAEMPEEFAVHVVGVEGFDGGLTVTLKPEVQDVWWNIDCGIKRDMLDELVDQWRTALHEAQDAKGTERSTIDVSVRTERGGLADWDEWTGATVYPLPRCQQ